VERHGVDSTQEVGELFRFSHSWLDLAIWSAVWWYIRELLNGFQHYNESIQMWGPPSTSAIQGADSFVRLEWLSSLLLGAGGYHDEALSH